MAHGDWCSAPRLGHSSSQQQQLARDLAEQLAGSGAAADAALLLVQYLGDVDGGVAALVAAREWREAMRVGLAAERADLVDTVVVPAAAQVRSGRGVSGVGGFRVQGKAYALCIHCE